MTAQRLALGAAGEQIAAEHLLSHGFRILDRNFRSGRGEIDIVAHRDGCIVFVEVKTKTGGGRELNPLLSIGPAKQLQVRRIASRWLRERRNRPFASEIRFDAIGIVVSAEGELITLQHVPSAF